MPNSHKHDQLTRFPEGSIREVWTIAYPLMLAAISGNLMMFCDRLILAHYSTDAMDAAVSAGMTCAVFLYGAMGISAIAEVFVGQYNGSKQKFKMGEPIWQMIWFSLMTTVLFVPIALWGGEIFIANEYLNDGLPFFQWIMLFGPLTPLFGAICAFFIGRGRTRIVFIVTVLGNLINLFLDLILVFGIEGWFGPMGTKGAAIATVTSEGIQVLILFRVFLSNRNREVYGTKKFQFKFPEFWKCLKIGTPNSVGHMIEIAAWALQLNLIAKVSKDHITVFAIAQTILILFAFTSDGMQKAVITISANFLGGKRSSMVRKTIYSALKLHIIFVIVIAIPLVIYPDFLLHTFLPHEVASSRSHLDILFSYTRLGLIWIWVFFIFDGITWILAGVFTAAGDTKFTMIMNAIAAWAFGIIPVYFIVVKGGHSPVATCKIVAFYAFLNCICFFLHYRRHKWRTKQVICSAEEIVEA
jgi:MATE family multidrug resistance protein